ncbi:MAG: group II intron reverse transcriptase/maturase [Anaerolineae bacterium]|nr:group II intron reverse transcriptase/maturase [Anaerolineae bacterium]
MTVVQATGAVSPQRTGWNEIDWQKAQQEVRRLQARIVKATQEGRWGQVKALQRLLTHSYSAKVLAIKRVTENDGRKTAGVDGVIWNSTQKKERAILNLKQRGYRPQPLRRVYIPKASDPTKKRPLGIPTMKDRAMQALYKMALEPVAETIASPHSYGFRKGRACRDAIEQCFIILTTRGRAQWVMEGDIKACFDGISHEWLLANIPLEKAILKKWLKAGYLEKGQLFPTEAGTPQGGIISPILANMALDGLEHKLREQYPRDTRLSRRVKVNLVRYADDFIITGSRPELLETEVKPLVMEFLKTRGLELSEEKTEITHVKDGFDFLGQNIRKYNNGKLLIKPSKKSVRKFIRRIRQVIRDNQHVSAGQLIVILNPIIRGWANYHRHVVSKAIFYSLHHEIVMSLLRWATRRHPTKGGRWRKRKYFKRVGFDKWVFFGQFKGKERELYNIGKVPIKRHIAVKAEANPFDPSWELYFEKRLERQMAETFEGRSQLNHLWKEQNGICPVCKQKITAETGWHNHHIVQRVHGGPDKQENRMLLHPSCHRLVHARHLPVEKPRPLTRALPKA